MELKWIEDFLSVAETKNFSRSAKVRHVTQPAFSRRIRALEAWLGADLFDRTCYPPELTAAGEAFKSQAIELVKQSYNLRALIRSMQPLSINTIGFALPHTLSLTFLPTWLRQTQETFGTFCAKLRAANVHDAVVAFTEGSCDFLLCYYHPRIPVEIDDARYESLRLGDEIVRPYSWSDDDGRPRYSLPGTVVAPAPFLAYSPNAYLHHITDLILESAPQRCHFEQRYETDMAEGLKAMALQGHGVAFLPSSVVAADMHQGRLVAIGGESWSVAMEIRLYKDRLNKKPLVEKFWSHIHERLRASAAWPVLGTKSVSMVS